MIKTPALIQASPHQLDRNLFQPYYSILIITLRQGEIGEKMDAAEHHHSEYPRHSFHSAPLISKILFYVNTLAVFLTRED
jgi:hypothetical protein